MDRLHAVQVDRPVDRIKIVLAEFEAVHEVRDHLRRAVVRDFEAHGIAVAARDQLAFDRAQQVVHFFFVHEQFGITRHPELVTARDLHAREQIVDMRVDDRRQEHEIVRPAGDFARQRDKPRQRARRLHHGHAAAAAEGVAPLEGNDEVQALVEDARERMRRVEPERTQHRQQLMLEIVPHPRLLLGVPFGAAHEADAFAFEFRDQQFVEHPVLFFHQPMRHLDDSFEYFLRAHVVRAGLHRARGDLLLQARHADFEKLVEIGVGDAQKTQPLEQRRDRVLGLFEHTAVELEQAEFAIDEKLGFFERFRCPLQFDDAHDDG